MFQCYYSTGVRNYKYPIGLIKLPILCVRWNFGGFEGGYGGFVSPLRGLGLWMAFDPQDLRPRLGSFAPSGLTGGKEVFWVVAMGVGAEGWRGCQGWIGN